MFKHSVRSVEDNKNLVEQYPFLRPVNWKTDEFLEDYDFTYTYADEMGGWWNAFGDMLCEEIRQELIRYDYLERFRIYQVKEKMGSLRILYKGNPKGSTIPDIIEKKTGCSDNR